MAAAGETVSSATQHMRQVPRQSLVGAAVVMVVVLLLLHAKTFAYSSCWMEIDDVCVLGHWWQQSVCFLHMS